MAHLLIENYQKLSLHKIGQSVGFLGRLNEWYHKNS